jgi:hypothetical protein
MWEQRLEMALLMKLGEEQVLGMFVIIQLRTVIITSTFKNTRIVLPVLCMDGKRGLLL